MMPYPTDPQAPSGPNWMQALTALIPMVGAGLAGQGTGMGAFGEQYARGAVVADEMQQRAQAQRAREQSEIQRLAFEREAQDQRRQDREQEKQLRALKLMDSLGPMGEAALADAEAAGLVYPDQQAEYATKSVRDALDSWAKMAPSLGLNTDMLIGGVGDLRAKASRRLITGLRPLYARMTDEATEPQMAAFRQDPTPRFGGLPFADFETLLPPEARWVPKTAAPAKGGSLEADLADARRRGDARATSEILALMGRRGAAMRAPREPKPGPDGGRPVLKSSATAISELNNSLADVRVLAEEITGTNGRPSPTGARAQFEAALPDVVTSLTGWGISSKQKNAVIARVKQVIGKALEGGVLRKEDEIKYAKILPTIADVPEVVTSKLAGLQRALERKRDNELDALEDAGYDVSKFRSRATGGAPDIRGGRQALKDRLRGPG